jgi:hypothetical protein
MKYLSFLLVTTLFVSCANFSQKKKAPKKTYSSDVEKSFEDIEKEKAIALYKKLRWENWKKIQVKRSAIQPRRRKKRITRKKTYYPKKKKVIERPALTPEKKKEVQIEISQNMSFFCMANRKDNRFKDENDCHAYTQNVLDTCQDQVQQPWIDKKIVRCVKRKLK